MSPRVPIGISDMAFYVPAPALALSELIAFRRRAGEDGERLDRALELTGQVEMRVPDWYEDTVTMVAEATRALLARNPRPRPSSIRHYCCGTETPLDLAKPVSSYCQGLVEVNGEHIGPNVAVYEVKHACAGGTYSLLNVLTSMQAEHEAGFDTAGIVTMGDTARYRRNTPAEMTQGAGAVALLLEPDPKLIAFDTAVVGAYSRSVDDFFRTLGSQEASVKGRFSIECYMEALLGAHQDFKRRALQTGLVHRPDGGHFLDAVDYVVFHAPFHSMPIMAMEELLARRRGITREQAAAEVERLRIRQGLETVRYTGNLYTGSLYFCLGSLLVEEHDRIGAAIEGKRILLFSYGSGNTMLEFSGTVVPGAANVVRNLGIREALSNHRRSLTPEEYEQLSGASFLAGGAAQRPRTLPTTEPAPVLNRAPVPPGRYALDRVREDGYRLYVRTAE
jgi:hydroxymethylglutaryl-CoA synthase